MAVTEYFHTVYQRQPEIPRINVSSQPEPCDQAVVPEFPAMVGMAARKRLCRVLEKKLAFGESLAVLIINASDLEHRNHSRGYLSGGAAIRELVHRINTGVENIQFVGRLGSTRFLAISNAQKKADRLSASIERLITHLSLPIDLSSGAVEVSCSIGVSVSLKGTENANELVGNGELALGTAEQGGFAFYQSEFSRRSVSA